MVNASSLAGGNFSGDSIFTSGLNEVAGSRRGFSPGKAAPRHDCRCNGEVKMH
jgi:hypothetical protein